jgi:hypothetical protein
MLKGRHDPSFFGINTVLLRNHPSPRLMLPDNIELHNLLIAEHANPMVELSSRKIALIAAYVHPDPPAAAPIGSFLIAASI